MIEVRLPGQIAVTSSPLGALISLDQVSTGRVTPDTLRDVSEDLHHVAVFLAGYWPPGEQPAEVTAGGVSSVHFDRPHSRGWINCSDGTLPSGDLVGWRADRPRRT
jgi:hypothetical protein